MVTRCAARKTHWKCGTVVLLHSAKCIGWSVSKADFFCHVDVCPQDLLRALNQGLQELIASGEYDSLLDKYGLLRPMLVEAASKWTCPAFNGGVQHGYVPYVKLIPIGTLKLALDKVCAPELRAGSHNCCIVLFTTGSQSTPYTRV